MLWKHSTYTVDSFNVENILGELFKVSREISALLSMGYYKDISNTNVSFQSLLWFKHWFFFFFQFLQWTSLLLLVAITSDIVLSAPTLPATNGTASECHLLRQYLNNKYPLTDPIKMPDGSVKFRIAMISDLDGSSVSTKESNTWYSYFKQGHLTYNAKDKAVTVEWDSAPDNGDQIKSDMSKNGRGLELSELVTYNGQLITLDDKTGLVYVFENKVLIPWVIVTEGDGHQKGGNITVLIYSARYWHSFFFFFFTEKASFCDSYFIV